MCNLNSISTNQAAIIAFFRVVKRYVVNQRSHFPTRERPMPAPRS
jgi:hypothetical protein